jgi:hypothetical protein
MNGYFESKVFSRQHAETWELWWLGTSRHASGHTDGLTVWWKTSSKTFVGGERLGPEGAKSKLFQLRDDDIVASIPPR